MKSVCKENCKGYFPSHRQRSRVKVKLAHTYFTENYAQDSISFLSQPFSSGVVLADLALIFY